MVIMKIFLSFFTLIFFSAGLFAQVPLNWTVDELNPGQDITLSPDEIFIKEGARSCHMQLNSGEVPYLISESYNVTAGRAYQFSMEVYDNDTLGQIRIYADFHDILGNDVFGEAPVFSADSSGWQYIGWEGTVPAEAVTGYVLIKYFCQPGLNTFINTANVWIDDTRFQEQGGGTLVANGGFEEWNVGWEETDPVIRLSIFPNPVEDYLYFLSGSDFDRLFIRDVTGKQLLDQTIEGSNVKSIPQKVDVSLLTRGIYILTFRFSDGRVESLKMVKY